MGQMADLVRDEGTTGATGFGPAVHFGSEHEVIDDELAVSLEQVEQTRLPVRTLEDVVFLDLHHRLPAPRRGQGILGTRGRLFLHEQFFMSGLPLLLRNDSGKRLRLPLHLEAPSCARDSIARPLPGIRATCADYPEKLQPPSCRAGMVEFDSPPGGQAGSTRTRL